MNVAVVLDSYATGAAALVAVALAPNVRGYLVAAHGGTFTHPPNLAHLGLPPVFGVGPRPGAGAGAALGPPRRAPVPGPTAGAAPAADVIEASLPLGGSEPPPVPARPAPTRPPSPNPGRGRRSWDARFRLRR